MEDANLPSAILLKEPEVQAQFAGYYYDSNNAPIPELINKHEEIKQNNNNVISTADVHISSA